MNLVELIKNQLSSDVVNRLAGTLGTSSENTHSAIGAAVPALLAGMTKLSDTSEGASRLASAVDNFDERMITNPAQALSGGSSNSLLERGSSLLGSLFGSNITSGLGAALSKFTGLGLGSISSLLGFLMPMILGGLKRQKESLGLDAGGLSNLLTSQKQNIISAMPSGLGSALGAIPGLNFGGFTDRIGQGASQALDAGRSAVNSAVDTGSRYGSAAANQASQSSRWIVPALALLVLAGLIWWIASRNTASPTVATQNPPARVNTPSPSNAEPAGGPEAGLAAANLPAVPSMSGIQDQVTGIFKSATDSFSKITDAASAEAALPKLRELNTQLDTVSTAMTALPASDQTQLSSKFESLWNTLRPAIDKVMAIPGVSDKIKPVVDQITAKFNSLTGK